LHQNNISRPGIPLTILLATLALTACHQPAPNPAPTAVAPATPGLELAASDIATVKQQSLQAGVAISGQLQAFNYTTAQAEVSASVSQVLFREGETVRKGQVLVQLATQDLQSRLKQAEAALASAKAEAVLAEAVLERNEQLRKDNYISDIDYKRGLAEAQARTENVKAQQALLTIARKALADAVITAPMTGVIAKRYVQSGQMLMTNGPVADIVDLNELELVATVPAEQVAALKTGQSLSFTVQGFDHSFSGVVSRINPVAEASTRAVTFYARVANNQQQLKAGLFVQGRLLVGQAEQGLAIPSHAIRYDDNKQAYIWLLKDHKLLKQAIVPGDSDSLSGQTLVTRGVAEGDTVVLAQLTANAANMPVTMAE
jgi:RND family efflux transporter MFP subunit